MENKSKIKDILLAVSLVGVVALSIAGLVVGLQSKTKSEENKESFGTTTETVDSNKGDIATNTSGLASLRTSMESKLDVDLFTKLEEALDGNIKSSLVSKDKKEFRKILIAYLISKVESEIVAVENLSKKNFDIEDKEGTKNAITVLNEKIKTEFKKIVQNILEGKGEEKNTKNNEIISKILKDLEDNFKLELKSEIGYIHADATTGSDAKPEVSPTGIHKKIEELKENVYNFFETNIIKSGQFKFTKEVGDNNVVTLKTSDEITTTLSNINTYLNSSELRKFKFTEQKDLQQIKEVKDGTAEQKLEKIASNKKLGQINLNGVLLDGTAGKSETEKQFKERKFYHKLILDLNKNTDDNFEKMFLNLSKETTIPNLIYTKLFDGKETTIKTENNEKFKAVIKKLDSFKISGIEKDMIEEILTSKIVKLFEEKNFILKEVSNMKDLSKNKETLSYKFATYKHTIFEAKLLTRENGIGIPNPAQGTENQITDDTLFVQLGSDELIAAKFAETSPTLEDGTEITVEGDSSLFETKTSSKSELSKTGVELSNYLKPAITGFDDSETLKETKFEVTKLIPLTTKQEEDKTYNDFINKLISIKSRL